MAAAVAVPLVYIGMNATVAYVVASAIVGAAIGAVTSAVMGGDIGQGALYGAIGGAVMGGLTVAFNPGIAGALEAGATTMGNEGYAAGMAQYNAQASGSLATGKLASGAVSQHDIGMVSGGIGNTSKSMISGITGGVGSGTEGIGTAVVKGGVEAYMKKIAAEDASEDAAKLSAEERAWKSQESALDRESALKIAETRAGGGSSGATEAAMINNEGAMARQKEQQKFEREERQTARQELKDDRKSFSDSVTSASDKFTAKTVKIGSFLNTPSWLQPKSNFGMDTSGTVASTAPPPAATPDAPTPIQEPTQTQQPATIIPAAA